MKNTANNKRFLVVQSDGAGLDDTYADEITDDVDTALAYIVEEIALWEDGTRLKYWEVNAQDAGEARFIPAGRATFGPWTQVFYSTTRS